MAPPREPDNLITLVRRCRQGDATAFDALFERLRGPVFAYLLRLVGDRHSAEDLTQEVFLKALEHLDSYREQGKFEAWLFRIAINQARDWGRRRRSSHQIIGGAAENDSDSATLAVDRAVHDPPEAAMENRDEFSRLEAAMAQLETSEREVLMLRHYGDLSFREIADTLNCPLGTVLARGHRALIKLREKLTASEKADRST